jgi:RHS repeat-associated protein
MIPEVMQKSTSIEGQCRPFPVQTPDRLPQYRFPAQVNDAAGMDYMLARYYSSSLGRFLSADPHQTPFLKPQTFNKYSYAWNTPLNATDPFGTDTYLVNRQLGGNETRSRGNPWSHTFIVTTDQNGNIEHTYSWGNTPDKKNENVAGKWYEDESEDITAAKEALQNGSAQKVGDESLDRFVADAFARHHDKKDDPSNHWNCGIVLNCKTESWTLILEARIDRAVWRLSRARNSGMPYPPDYVFTDAEPTPTVIVGPETFCGTKPCQ